MRDGDMEGVRREKEYVCVCNGMRLLFLHEKYTHTHIITFL